MTQMWLRVVLLAVLWTTSILADTKTCELNQDGTCVDEESRNTSNSSGCNDDHTKCPEWAKLGECQENPAYMLRNCKKSCNICNENLSVDALIEEAWKKKNKGQE